MYSRATRPYHVKLVMDGTFSQSGVLPCNGSNCSNTLALGFPVPFLGPIGNPAGTVAFTFNGVSSGPLRFVYLQPVPEPSSMRCSGQECADCWAASCGENSEKTLNLMLAMLAHGWAGEGILRLRSGQAPPLQEPCLVCGFVECRSYWVPQPIGTLCSDYHWTGADRQSQRHAGNAGAVRHRHHLGLAENFL